MKKLLALAVFLFSFIQAMELCAVPDSCLSLYCPYDIVNYNPDRIMIDTCKGSPTYGDWFQSGKWTIGFKRFFLRDSVDFVTNRNPSQINGIDSINFPQLYSAFKIIEEKFGVITLKRDNYVCFRNSDSAYYKEPCMIIYFNKLNRTKDVEYYLNQLPEIAFVHMTNYPVKSNLPASCLELIWPNNPPDSYNPDYIMIDTCWGSPTYGKRYRSGTFCIALDYYVFSHLIENADYADIYDIDTVKYKDFRDSCMSLEKRLGEISFYRDPDICNNRYDTFFLTEPCLAVNFSKYNLEDDSWVGLTSLPGVGIKGVWLRYTPYPSDVEDLNNNSIELKPNPCFDRIKIVNYEHSFLSDNKITVYNFLGNPLISIQMPDIANNFEIDVSSWEEGIYFIKINNKLYKFLKLR